MIRSLPDTPFTCNGSAPQASVIVINWNRRELLSKCLQSLLDSLEDGLSFEIIVVDNGSSDGSPELVEAFARTAPVPVFLIRNGENRGFCAANNQGIAAARGSWIALLNNDAEADRGWLGSMVRAIANRPQVGMIACKILVFEDPRRIDKIGHLIWPDGQNRGRGTGESDNGQYDREEEVLWPDGCAALYRKSMLDEIGGFDEDLFAYGDDAELGLRARWAGWRCLYTPLAVVRHHRGSTLGLLSSRRLELIERNRILLAVRHFPISLLALNLPWFAARLFGGWQAGLRGRGEAARFSGLSEKLRLTVALGRGWLEALIFLPRTWRKRREFRHRRKLSSNELLHLLFTHKISLRALSEEAA